MPLVSKLCCRFLLYIWLIFQFRAFNLVWRNFLINQDYSFSQFWLSLTFFLTRNELPHRQQKPATWIAQKFLNIEIHHNMINDFSHSNSILCFDILTFKLDLWSQERFLDFAMKSDLFKIFSHLQTWSKMFTLNTSVRIFLSYLFLSMVLCSLNRSSCH